jgi:ABC-type Fe3+ transport system permease subunit
MDNYNNQQPPQPPPYGPPPSGLEQSVMSFKDWIITILLSSIPCVGFILLIVWSVSNTGNENRRNYARASLIVTAIAVVVGMVLSFVLGGLTAMLGNIFDSYYY